MKTNLFQPSRRFAWLGIAAVLLAFTPRAQAHILGGEAGGFASGFHHPWSGLDHICAMVAVGLWGAQLGGRAMWLLPVVFPLVMSVGGFFGLIGVPLPGQEIGIALSALLLGAMVCFQVKPKHLVWPALLVGAFGFYHGHAHGVELPPGESGLLYSIGFVIATGTLHLCGISFGLVHRWAAGKVALRVAGAAIAVCGIYFLWMAFQPETIESAPAKAKVSVVAPGNLRQRFNQFLDSRMTRGERSAELNSAVSPIFNRQAAQQPGTPDFLRVAEFNSAIRQIKNLRYG